MKKQSLQFSKDQQFFLDRIQNKELKTLVSESHTFSRLNDKEKTNLLMYASIVRKDPQAEQELINIFREDKEKIKNAFETTPTLTPEEQIQQDAILEQEYEESKQAITKLKKGVLDEKEKQSTTIDKKKMHTLLGKL